MKKKYGLVLEGGAQRGIFTAGVLDYFMEKNLVFPYVVGASAGAESAVSYLAGQPGRMRSIMTYDGPDAYIGKRAKQRCGKPLDLHMIFNKYPYDQFPLDFAAYFSSGIQREFVVTNVLSGEAEYLSDRNDEKRLINVSKACAALPVITDPVYIDGAPYLDGSIAEPVAVKRAFVKGCQKCVVVLTKPEGYVPKQPINLNASTSVMYRKYPEFLQAYNARRTVYQSRMNLLNYLERAGMVYVIRPTMPEVNRFEDDVAKLDQLYLHGYDIAKEKIGEICEFLGEQDGSAR